MITEATFVAALTWALTNLIKAIPSIPVVKGQTARIRTVAAIAAIVSSVGVALADGDLTTVATPEVLNTAAVAAVGWLASHFLWKGQKIITS